MENEAQMFEFKEFWVRSTATNDNNDYQLRNYAVLEFFVERKSVLKDIKIFSPIWFVYKAL